MHVDVVLLQSSSLCCSSQDGWTALMIAAREGHVNVVRVLLDAGADANAKNNVSGC